VISSVKAVIPAAGFGTRLEPLTLAFPKELLPVNRRPMVQLAVEEALSSGVRDVGIVIRQGKESIQKYFEALLQSTSPTWETLRRSLSTARLRFIFQRQPLGLGNAIYEAKSFIRDSPFVMIIPDQFVVSEVPATRQLLEAAATALDSVWSSVVYVARDKLELFPGTRRFVLSNKRGHTWKVEGFREDLAYSNGDVLLGFGRTFFPADALEYFSEKYINPATGEVDLLLTFESLIEKFPNYAVLLDGMAMDCGTWDGYEHFFSAKVAFSRNCNLG
jgi:UTP--glucose-1-phosphate uridylyltransferase